MSRKCIGDGRTSERENVLMRRPEPWLLAGLLVAVALLLAFLAPRRSDESLQTAPALPDETVASVPAEEIVPETGDLELAALDQRPEGLAAQLLRDSDVTRRNLLTMSIRDAGHDCPEVRSAEPLAPGGDAWRAYCGELRLYWIEIDEFSRISVEPGAYDESDFVPGGSRTITIRQEDMQQLQEVR